MCPHGDLVQTRGVPLDDCLPAQLRGPDTIITRIAAGLSGAGVFRVEAGERAYVLKVAPPADDATEDGARWMRKLAILRNASEAGVAPRVVHVDEARRAVVSELVVDRSFPAWLHTPSTHDLAIDTLGATLAAVHGIPLAPEPDPDSRPPRAFLDRIWSGLSAAGFALPGFVGDAVQRTLDLAEPTADRPPVLSHNDVNPTNLVYDGRRVVLLDWDMAGTNDPYVDLATVAMFMMMDDASCLRLLSAHDGGTRMTALPLRFTYTRTVIATLVGVMFLHLAREAGHAGSSTRSLDAVASLAGSYAAMRAGSLQVGTPDGRFDFGLSLIKSRLGHDEPRV